MMHSSYHEESRGIEGGQRPEITNARNDESPKENNRGVAAPDFLISWLPDRTVLRACPIARQRRPDLDHAATGNAGPPNRFPEFHNPVPNLT
jgi:hypothetical protein